MMIWFDSIWFDLIQFGSIWFVLIWFDSIWFALINVGLLPQKHLMLSIEQAQNHLREMVWLFISMILVIHLSVTLTEKNLVTGQAPCFSQIPVLINSNFIDICHIWRHALYVTLDVDTWLKFFLCIFQNAKFGINICGEGGEYETMTIDCPLFLKKIVMWALCLGFGEKINVANAELSYWTHFHVYKTLFT